MFRCVIGTCLFLASCIGVPATSPASPDAGLSGRPSHEGDAGDLTETERDGQAQESNADQAPQPLIDPMLLRRAENAGEDPVPEHRPEPVLCNEEGAYIEGGQLEINTGVCNYASFAAPAQRALTVGQKVNIHITHFDLTALEPSQAHVALFAGRERMWETYVDIPRRADVIDATFKAPFAIVRGELITFHLHNHGQNSWRLVGVGVVPTRVR